jgi:hypothetical protein
VEEVRDILLGSPRADCQWKLKLLLGSRVDEDKTRDCRPHGRHTSLSCPFAVIARNTPIALWLISAVGLCKAELLALILRLAQALHLFRLAVRPSYGPMLGDM